MKSQILDEPSVSVERHQYLTFRLKDEEFGVGILKAKEILEYAAPTRVPMMPEFIRGVINLRGNVVPVVDLSTKFHLPVCEMEKRACVVIVEVNIEGEQMVMGVLVDAVSEVMEIPPDGIEPAPSFGTKIKVDFIQGMAKSDKGFTILLDIDKVLSGDELAAVDKLWNEGAAMVA